MMTSTVSWQDYRKVKLRLIVLLVDWIPFGILMGALVPVILHSYTPSYVGAVIYMLVIGFNWLRCGFYPCPVCGTSYRGSQLYRKTCAKCGTPINQSPALDSN
jgi:hypothetical protein